MKGIRFSVALFVFAFFLASFVLPKTNTISVYINGKTIPDNTVLTHEQNGSGIVLRAQIPSGARFNELTCTLPSTAVGTYPLTMDGKSKVDKAKITYNAMLNGYFNSQADDNTKGFVKVVASSPTSLQVEFECTMTSKGQKLVLKMGKVQVNFQQ